MTPRWSSVRTAVPTTTWPGSIPSRRGRARVIQRGQPLPVIAAVADGTAYDRLWALRTTENPTYPQSGGRTAHR